MITDVPSTVSKRAPDFCTVYVIGKSKISFVKPATFSVPQRAPPPAKRIEHQASTASEENNAQIVIYNPKPRGFFLLFYSMHSYFTPDKNA